MEPGYYYGFDDDSSAKEEDVTSGSTEVTEPQPRRTSVHVDIGGDIDSADTTDPITTDSADRQQAPSRNNSTTSSFKTEDDKSQLGLWRCTAFILRVVVAYSVVMSLCALFVFLANICMELTLFISDRLILRGEVMKSTVIYIPQFIIILVICYKFTTKCWKTLIIIWKNKYDDDVLEWRCCGFRALSLSKGTLFRIAIFVAIVGNAVHQTVHQVFYGQDIDDLIIFKNLNVSAVVIGSYLCGIYLVAGSVWRLWVLFGCIWNFRRMLRFFALDFTVGLEEWHHGTQHKDSRSFSKAMCAEMKALEAVSSELRRERRKLKSRCRSTERERNHDIDSKSASEEKEGDDERKRKWLMMSAKMAVLIWYFVQCLAGARIEDAPPLLKWFCALVPLLLYFSMLTGQCRVKLFQYLSGWKSSSGPMIIKILLTIWLIMLIIAGSTFIMFQSVDHLKKDAVPHFPGKDMIYPFCRSTEQRDRLFEATFYSKMIYEEMTTKEVNRISRFYFDHSKAGDAKTAWKVMNGQRFDKRASPIYLHLQRKKKNGGTEHMIVVRGTKGAADFHQDFSMYSEWIALKAFSRLIPIWDLWPRSMIQWLIHKMSVTEGIIFKDAQNRHYQEIMEYVESKKAGIHFHGNDNLLIVGHSLGGIVSHIVAAKLKAMDRNENGDIQSIGISNPGLVLSSNKFGIESGILSRTSTTIVPDSDPVAAMDIQTGSVHHIACKSASRQQCHMGTQTVFEIYDSCSGIGRGATKRFREFMQYYRHHKHSKRVFIEALDAVTK